MTIWNGNDSDSHAGEKLDREARYLRTLADHNAARILTADAMNIAVRSELEQKRRGFRLLAELAASLGDDTDFENVFLSVSRRLNATLNMQRTAVLFPDGDSGYRAAVLQGYSSERKDAIMAGRIPLAEQLLNPLHPLLITGADPVDYLACLREALDLPYLIISPIVSAGHTAAVLITGRTTEEMPFLPRLNASDVETVQTVSAFLAAMVTGRRLRQAEELAKRDPLTRLANLRGAIEQLQRIIALARRSGTYAAVMFVDLDGFKAVNDTYGHAAGDRVLQIIASRLNACLRESDFVGRIGGDEFLLAVTNIRCPDNAGLVASHILEKLMEPIEANGFRCQVGASIGIAVFPDNGGDVTTLIREADKAMYAIKNTGKNAYAFAEKNVTRPQGTAQPGSDFSGIAFLPGKDT